MTSTPVRLTKKYSPDRYKRYARVAEDAHEWVSFEDPDEYRRWTFDVTFLLSNWNCIFGRGCKGVLTEDAENLVQGCCSYGAHFADTADVKRIKQYARRLGPDQWQFHDEAKRNGFLVKERDGETKTRVYKGACIFANRPEFGRGAGCALHVGALDNGESYIDWKPEVCWQLPLHRDDDTREDGYVISTISQWDRGNWGDGGYEFHWWCTEAQEAFTAKKPVYVGMRDELIAMVGPKVYTMLSAYLDKRRRGPSAPLTHPVKRTNKKG